MKKITTTLLFICIVLSLQAQLLWKVSGNGLEKPSFIFGTHHLAPYSIMDQVKGLEEAFAATTQVVGELKTSEMQSPATMQLMQQQMMMDGDKTIESLFTPEQYQMVNTFVKENMFFDLSQMPKVKPAFVTNNIVLLLYMKNVPGYNPQEQLDSYFQTKALENGKNLVALETMQFQIDVLFNSSSVERQAEVLVCTLENIDKTLEMTKKLTTFYMAHDLNALLALAEEREGTKCDPTPEEMAILTDNRNIAWMQQLPTLMQQQPTFVAVGALHLMGEKGLINLLRKAGYTVEPNV